MSAKSTELKRNIRIAAGMVGLLLVSVSYITLDILHILPLWGEWVCVGVFLLSILILEFTTIRCVLILTGFVLWTISLFYRDPSIWHRPSVWDHVSHIYAVIALVILLIGWFMEQFLHSYCEERSDRKMRIARLCGAYMDYDPLCGWCTTQLMSAARGSLEEKAAFLLKHGANINAQDSGGRTPIMCVKEPRFGSEELGPQCAVNTAMLLLKNGADLWMHDDKGLTALHHAAISGQSLLMRVYLKKGVPVDINFRDVGGITPLMAAACYNQEEAIRTLLSHGADINAADSSGRTALMYAVGAADSELSEATVDSVWVSLDGGRLMYADAARDGNFSTAAVRILLESGANVRMEDEACRTALDYAMLLNKEAAGVATAIKLLEAADPSAARRVAPAATGLPGVAGAAPDSGLAAACREGDVAKVNLMLKNGADANRKGEDGSTPLIEAVKAGHDGLICMLCKMGADVDGTDAADMTALMHACAAGRTEAVNTLVELGADVSHIDSQGRTAETLAAAAGDKELCLYLRDLLKEC